MSSTGAGAAERKYDRDFLLSSSAKVVTDNGSATADLTGSSVGDGVVHGNVTGNEEASAFADDSSASSFAQTGTSMMLITSGGGSVSGSGSAESSGSSTSTGSDGAASAS